MPATCGRMRDTKFVTTKQSDAADIPGQAYKNDIGSTVQHPYK